jgi:hypothetical protein
MSLDPNKLSPPHLRPTPAEATQTQIDADIAKARAILFRDYPDIAQAYVDQARCAVAAEHHGPLIAVAGRGNATVMMCTRHAMAWTESDSCQNEAWRGSMS